MRLLLVALLFASHAFSMVEVYKNDDKQVKIFLGTRLQALVEYEDDAGTSQADLYLRRTRFNFAANYADDVYFYMDLRNDKANLSDNGNGGFEIGDAYFSVPGKGKEAYFKFARAKVDVSRTQTVSSSKVLSPTRVAITDFAAEYVSHNRRAANIQYNAHSDHFYYQLVVGKGPQGDKFDDANGTDLKDSSVGGSFQKNALMKGGKVIFYPFKNMKHKKLSEVYEGKGKNFGIGVGYFDFSGADIKTNNGVDEVERTLTNIETTFLYNNLFISAEYFQFDGLHQDLTVDFTEVKSDGGYVQASYYLESLKVSPYLRFSTWDKNTSATETNLDSFMVGANYFHHGNKVRFGAYYKQEEWDQSVEKNKTVAIYTMMNL